MTIKKLLFSMAAGFLVLGTLVASAFATQSTDLTTNQWRLLTITTLPSGNTNFLTGHPSAATTGVEFSFPAPTDGHMVYMLGNYNNDLTGKTITVDANWTPSTSYVTRGPASDGAYARVEFQDVTSGAYTSNDYWWYKGQVLNLNTMSSGSISAALSDRANWTNVCGQVATDTTAHPGPNCVGGTDPNVSPYDGFTNAMKDVKQLGLSFGRGSSYASGVANSTPATFNLTNYTIN